MQDVIKRHMAYETLKLTGIYVHLHNLQSPIQISPKT